jgi:HEAT repeat protein
MPPLRLPPVDAEIPEASRRAVECTLDGLLVQLVQGDPEARRRAALDLADVPEAIPALVQRVGVELDPTVRDAICSQLVRHDRPEVVDGLIEHLASDDAGLRNAVAVVLSQTLRSTVRRMPDLLADPDPDVRILTVAVLGALRAVEVKRWLAHIVATDPHPNVVSAAIGELAPIAGDCCGPALRSARQRFPNDPYIAFAVARAMGGSDDTSDEVGR